MDTKELEKFCPRARIRLIDEVRQRCYAYGLDDAGREEFDRDATIVKGTVLSALERSQRSELYRRIEHDGYARFCEEMAYTWFNRFAAIRYMEVRGYLPCGVRMLSSYCETSEYDSFSPDCLRMPTELDLPGLERDCVFDLVAAADDEALFRLILVAQMNELAECLPAIFGRVGTADALLLPTRLLDRGEEGVLCALVERVKRSTWENVESLGWMYQFYNSEVKDAFFKSKAKETPDTIGPATQLFTPNWIVRYMVQNSLGRLWMLNNPESPLRDKMEYYIEPDAEHEDFIKIESPEDISLCDPACGSGHILVYAFELLAKMYLEREYRSRDIPGLILSKNLHGMEIDSRAAQIAGLALAMCAREMDRRFFNRGVQADIAVLEPVMLEEDDIPHGAALAKKKDLIDALSHLDEVGSLLAPSEGDLAALREAIELIGTDGLFDGSSKTKLECALKTCEALARRHDCVVANPPYMGLRSLGSWYADWVRRFYPGYSSDLYACFISRSFQFARKGSYSALVTIATWTVDKGLLSARRDVLSEHPVICMMDMSPTVMPIAFETTATVFSNAAGDYSGTFLRVLASDLADSRDLRSSVFQKLDKFRCKPSFFHRLPDSVIAYGVTESMADAFASKATLASFLPPRVGIQTGDTDRFIRLWWEVPSGDMSTYVSANDYSHCGTWVPYKNGGDFRKWYGNSISVIHWGRSGEFVFGTAQSEGRKVMDLPVDYRFKPLVSWGDYGLGKASFRYCGSGHLFDVIEPAFVDTERAAAVKLSYIQGFANSSTADAFIQLLMPGRHKNVRKMGYLPLLGGPEDSPCAVHLVEILRDAAKADWDSFETSWDFKRHPLL